MVPFWDTIFGCCSALGLQLRPCYALPSNVASCVVHAFMHPCLVFKTNLVEGRYLFLRAAAALMFTLLHIGTSTIIFHGNGPSTEHGGRSLALSSTTLPFSPSLSRVALSVFG